MDPTEIDLTNCDKEPIQFLGKIQSYGFLVGVAKKNAKIIHVSANLGEFIHLSAEEVLGKKPDVFNPFIKCAGAGGNFRDLYDDLITGGKSANGLSDTTEVLVNGQKFYFSLSETGEMFILELEPVMAGENGTNLLFNMVSRVAAAKTLSALYEIAAKELKDLTGFERVMVYRFLEDGAGEVVGEAIDKHVESFMGQRYPESDIPKQARELYSKNHMRSTADVDAETFEIIGAKNTPVPDLTYCSLRAASPTHILYLKNMGVASSFSISIMIDDKLWGLMAFQNCTAPKFTDLRVRQAAKLLTGVVASQIAAKNTEYGKILSEQFQSSILRLQNYLTLDDSIVEALTKHSISVLNINLSAGAALVFGPSVITLGETPDKNEVIGIASWAAQNVDEIFHTNKLVDYYPPATGFLKKGAGVLVSVLNAGKGDMIIWFKPENIYTIQWAGKPAKKVEIDTLGEEGPAKILPRTSFKVIKEVVKETSENWNPGEVDAAIKITKYIKDQILKRTQKQLEFNEKLKEAYDELDSFTYTVSHDLKTPLTVIRTYAQFLTHSRVNLDDKSRTIVKNIVTGTDKITFMLQKLLELSKISRQEFKLEPINVRKIIDNVIKEQTLIGDLSRVKIQVGETPELKGNETLLYHVFANVISNAFKYSSKKELPVIEINGYHSTDRVIYEIADNGVGMEERQQAAAFKLFGRLENALEFEGTGAGLAIAKKIMEKHGGEITFSSKPGKGTKFYLTFIRQEATN